MPSHFNNNFIILIPKTKAACSVDQFRPIILGNFLFKIIMKILASRPGDVVKSIFSDNQFEFVKAKKIHDGITIVFEGINCLDRYSSMGNMAIKIVIQKAFDIVRWDFLLYIL